MTDKERAQVIREEVERAMSDMPNGLISDVANRLREQADRLDPPEPEISNAHVWVRYAGGWWIPGVVEPEGYLVYDADGHIFSVYDARVEIRRIRTLEPGQVAVDRSDARSAIGALHIRHSDAAAQRILTALDRDTEANK